MSEETTFHQFKLRLPAELLQRLEDAARTSGRSLSAEMVFRLETTFPRSIEAELVDQRKIELQRLDTQIQYLAADLEHRRHRMRRQRLNPETVDYQDALASVLSLEARIASLSAMRDAVLSDLAQMMAARTTET